ncbi:MAG: relaxase [Pseudomonadota bacterium]
MIIVASQRGGAKQLGEHLMNARDNEHVELHEIRGFISSDVIGAFKEAQAISKGTKCKQFLFSVSFNPPEKEHASVEAFEDAIHRVEEANGLTGQPRVMVFHEKEGRRHAHCVWSRIDAETMKAKQLSFYKEKIMTVSRELYREHGWTMPKGMIRGQERDPRNFTLAEWQQSKRAGFHARDLKGEIQDCLAASDSRAAFCNALEERGMRLAKGDRRSHVIVTHQGEVLSAARYAGVKTKELRERLGPSTDLPSIDETKDQFVKELTERSRRHLEEVADQHAKAKAPVETKRREMTEAHRQERDRLKVQQDQRWQEECRQRSERFRPGWRGLWDRVSGAHQRIEQRNIAEALEAQRRDTEQRVRLRQVQLQEREQMQDQLKALRAQEARAMFDVHKELKALREGKLEQDRQEYRYTEQKRLTKLRPTRAEHPRADKRLPQPVRPSPNKRPQQPTIERTQPKDRLSALRGQRGSPTQDRLAQLRSKQDRGRDGPELER